MKRLSRYFFLLVMSLVLIITGASQAFANEDEFPTDISLCNIELSRTSYTYNGNRKHPEVYITNEDGYELCKGIDYTILYRNNLYVGTGSVDIVGVGEYTGSVTENFNIAKGTQSIGWSGNGRTYTTRSSKLTKTKTYYLKATSKGKRTYKKVSGNSKITVSAGGKVTVKKGLKRGKYRVYVKVNAASTKYYKYRSVKKYFTVIVKKPASSGSRGGSGTVYWTPSGSVYHVSRNCPTLARSKTVYSGSRAASGKSRCCKVCG